jgi:hypothetical protein
VKATADCQGSVAKRKRRCQTVSETPMSSDANDIHEIERRLKTARERLERAMSNVTL